MKRILTNVATIALTVVTLLGYLMPGSADGRAYRRNSKHHAHIAYVEYVPTPAYGACRTGWWQTLRYGHVQPTWGTWCR